MKPRILILMILSVAAMRILPHPLNFTPVGALALFAGAQFAYPPLAFIVPLAAMFASDLFLGFSFATPAVYICFILSVCMGRYVQNRVSVKNVAGVAVASSILFFVVTNFAVFLSGMYPMTEAGFLACYAAALPFFQNTLAGNLAFSALLFGGFALVEKKILLKECA